MELAKLGIEIDPSAATKGEKEVTSALDRIDKASERLNQNMKRQTADSKKNFSAMAESVRTAASGMRSAFDGMANAVGIFSPKLGFALQALRGFSAMVGQTASSMKNLGAGAAAAGGGLRGMAAAVGSVVAVLGTVTVVIGGLLAVLLPLIVAFKAVTGAFNLFSDGLQGAARFETLKVRFAGVLGSMEAAETRMKSLAKLAAATPFDLEGISEASLTLESLTGGLWSNEKALIAVGDAAAKSGQTIGSTADQIGRIYAGLKTGVGFDDPLRTLTAKGVFAPEVYQQLMAMNKEGAKFEAMWAIITAQLERAGGAMQNLSVTFEGRVSTMKDAWDEFKRTLGEAILPAATDVVKALTAGIGKLTEYAKSIQPEIKAMADNASAFLAVLTTEGGLEAALRAAGDTLEEALNGGFMEFVNTVNTWIKNTFGVDLKAAVNDLVNADVWTILSDEIFPKLGEALLRALRNAVLGAFEGIGNFITGGAAGAVGNYVSQNMGTGGGTGASGVAYQNMGGMMPGAELPFMPEDTTPNVIGDTPGEAERFMGENSLLPDINGVVADGGTIADNTQAIAENTKAIEDTIPVYGPDQLMPPDQGAPAPGSEFGWMMDNARAQQEADRAADAASMSFKTPSAGGSGFMPTRRAGRVGGGGKSDAEKMQDEGTRIMESLRTPEEEMNATIANLEKLKAAGAISAETFSRGVAKAKEEYNSAVESMTEKTKAAAEAQMSELQKLMVAWGDVAKRTDELTVGIANSISSNMTSAITGMINGTMTAKEAFSKMAASIVNDILEMTTKMLVQLAISRALGWVGGVGGAAGASVGAAAAAVAHQGGVVGFLSESRTVGADTFRGAPKYHQGGTVGLQPGEVPIIAQKGETITTEDQERMKSRLRGEKAPSKASMEVTNLNVVDARMIDEHVIKNPDAIMNVISRNKARVKQIIGVNQ